jgi:methionyl-tRNA formyltransferase
MKVIILTSSLHGTASHHLDYLTGNPKIEIRQVFYNEGKLTDKKKLFYRKLKKVLNIGLFGALNGMRMRKWYGKDIEKYVKIENLEEKCSRLNIPFTRIKSINSDETARLVEISEPDLGISLGNGYIRERIYSIPKYGMLNIHHEILPQYQNAQSIIWQIYNGSSETGYTIHKIDRKIDTGEIILQEFVPIYFRNSLKDTVTFTFVKLLEKSAKGLVKVLEGFEQYAAQMKTQGTGSTYTTPRFGQMLRIWRQFHILKNKQK